MKYQDMTVRAKPSSYTPGPGSCVCIVKDGKLTTECQTMKRLRRELYQAMREQFNSESHQRLANQLYEHARHAIDAYRVVVDLQRDQS
jgi:hypothetical protein